MDVKLPGMSGLEATCKIREFRPDRVEYPVLIITAYDRYQTKEKGDTSQITGYLAKPFSPQELTDFVNHHYHTKLAGEAHKPFFEEYGQAITALNCTLGHGIGLKEGKPAIAANIQSSIELGPALKQRIETEILPGVFEYKGVQLPVAIAYQTGLKAL
ncbi:response regulator [Candidatus Woesearchaeota archaeon]|nr:response regulator [Candidatus Woesearchaeota archaeon]